MAKTLIDVDDEALEAAMTALGTSTKVATVNEALREVVRRHKEQHRDPGGLFRWLNDPDMSDFHDPQVMAGAWGPCEPIE